jgi:UPF0176 protein
VSAFQNLRAYRFVTLSDPAAWRDAIHARAGALALKGTVLLASEGINLYLCGSPAAIGAFVDWLRADPLFAELAPRYAASDTPAFRRLKVKVKAEIIRMDRPAIRPEAQRAAAVDPATLARWLAIGRDDRGNDVILLDTRNGFEIDAGRFEGAIDWRLARFGDFPAALEAGREQLAGKTVVSYCTGGIRCEKAALLMREQGIDAWQLDGGILGYFDAVGSAHFEGRCFVFDEREQVAAH